VAGTFPASSLTYTQYQGKQIALPLLVDAYGLYYNKDMFAAAGITDPPKTLTELTADIQKLTIKNPDGTIKQWGLTPPRSDYDVSQSWYLGGGTGAQFYDANGKSTFGTDPTWATLLNWEKSTLDYYGSANVDNFVATYSNHTDDEQNPFASGVSAMELNGEWHIGELDSEVPNLNYGIAPVPVPDAKASIYGAGQVVGSVMYISSAAKDQSAAFFVAQQLATDTAFVTDFATQMSNVPTTFDALKAWTAPQTQPLWNVMMNIVSNPNSYYKTLTPAGAEDVNAWTTFIQNWESGQVSDLSAGLTQLDAQIATINQQATQ
jgi:multiple sugar transport system substrate-binding protein